MLAKNEVLINVKKSTRTRLKKLCKQNELTYSQQINLMINLLGSGLI